MGYTYLQPSGRGARNRLQRSNRCLPPPVQNRCGRLTRPLQPRLPKIAVGVRRTRGRHLRLWRNHRHPLLEDDLQPSLARSRTTAGAAPAILMTPRITCRKKTRAFFAPLPSPTTLFLFLMRFIWCCFLTRLSPVSQDCPSRVTQYNKLIFFFFFSYETRIYIHILFLCIRFQLAFRTATQSITYYCKY